jgi:hypothetical protein
MGNPQTHPPILAAFLWAELTSRYPIPAPTSTFGGMRAPEKGQSLFKLTTKAEHDANSVQNGNVGRCVRD